MIFGPEVVARVEVKDLEAAQAGLERNARQVEQGTREGTKAVTIMVWRAIRVRAPRRTGRLQGSFTYEFRYLGRKAEGHAYSNLYYARYVNDGTRWFAGRRYVDKAVDVVQTRVGDTFTGKIRIT